MQIERLNYLVFPPESKSPAGAKDTSTSKSAAPPVPSTPTPARPSIPVLIDRVEDAIAPSAVVVISTPAAKLKDIANTAAPYYSREGKTNTPPPAPNLEAMEHAHQQAVARQGSAVTGLSLGHDGVVVARPLNGTLPPKYGAPADRQSPPAQTHAEGIDVAVAATTVGGTGSAFSQIHPHGDFVSLAVSAMRQFKDDNERQARHAPALTAAPAELSAGPLRSLQQLASRFNLFA